MIDVITIGTATRDVFLESHLFRIVRDPKHLRKLGFPTGEAQCFALGGKINVRRPTLAFGGGAANAAVTFRRADFRTAALAKIGCDENGEAVIKNFKEHGITSLAAIDDKVGTAYSVVLLSPSGERTILNYRGASEDLQFHEISKESFKTKVAYIVPGKIEFKVINSIVDTLRKRGVFIAMNPSSQYLELGAKKLRPMLSKIDLITLNREEAADLTGRRYKDEAAIFRGFDALVPGLAVMTDGPNGVFVSNGKKIWSAGVFKNKKIVNRTGAGDAFGSGFVAGLLRRNSLSRMVSDEDIAYAIRLASANATSVVEHMGAQTGILTRTEFEKNPRWEKFPIKVKNLG